MTKLALERDWFAVVAAMDRRAPVVARCVGRSSARRIQCYLPR